VSWAAKQVRLALYGSHPDYDPDAGVVWCEGKEPEKLRYFTDGKRMRLWLAHGRTIQDVGVKRSTPSSTPT
jgi:hypothetical protein